MNDKKSLRAMILKKRDAMAPVVRKEKSRIITERVLSLDAYQDADALLAFASYGSEVDTDEIILSALADKKTVYLPRVCGPGDMRFFRIDDLDELETGYKGIREPAQDPDREFRSKSVIGEISICKPKVFSELILVPGVAFDGSGGRIGYGKGFYDRFLSAYGKDMKIYGIAFSEQILPEGTIPMDEYDVPIRDVITDDVGEN